MLGGQSTEGAVETEDGPDAGSPARASTLRSLRTKLETEKLRATGYFTQKEREGAKAPNPQTLDPHPATYAATVCPPGQQKGRRHRKTGRRPSHGPTGLSIPSFDFECDPGQVTPHTQAWGS